MHPARGQGPPARTPQPERVRAPQEERKETGSAESIISRPTSARPPSRAESFSRPASARLMMRPNPKPPALPARTIYAQLRQEQFDTVYDTSFSSALPRSSVTCPLYTQRGTTASTVRPHPPRLLVCPVRAYTGLNSLTLSPPPLQEKRERTPRPSMQPAGKPSRPTTARRRSEHCENQIIHRPASASASSSTSEQRVGTVVRLGFPPSTGSARES